MRVVKATVHGAVSIVNAIATGKGAALGISKKTDVEIGLGSFFIPREVEFIINWMRKTIQIRND